MSTRKTLIAVAAIVGIVICAGSIQAKELRNSLEIQGFGQWAAVDVLEGSFLTREDNGWGGGFTLGYNIIDWFEVEFDYSHLKNDFTVWDSSVNVLCFIQSCSTNTNTFTFFGTFNIPAGEFVSPYVRIGVGGFVSDNDLWRTTGASVALGAGTRIFPIPDNGLNLRVGADLAGFFPTNRNGFLADAFDQSSMNVRVTFGIGYVIDFSR